MALDSLSSVKKGSLRKIRVLAILLRLEVPHALEDGRVPLEYLNEDLEILIPRFEGMKEGDEFKLYLRQNYFGSTYTLSADDEENPDFKVRFFLGKDSFPPEGAYTEVALDYEYIEADAEEGFRSGKPFTVIFDRQPPGGSSLRALSFSLDQNEDVTEDDLEEGQLPATAYAWFGMEVGDVITPWVSELPPSVGSPEQYLIDEAAVEIAAADVGRNTRLLFPAGYFSGVGDRYFGYQLRDKLGNTSALSATVKLAVDL